MANTRWSRLRMP